MELYFISLCLLVIGGIISIFVKENYKMKLCAVITGVSTILLTMLSVACLLSGESFGAQIHLPPIFESVDFVIDPLSAFFVLVISVLSFLGTMYACGYIKPYLNKGMNLSSHAFFLMLLIVSMIGVVTIQNSLLFIVLWEIMSLSSFFLVIFEGDKKEVLNAGIKYLIYTHISMILILSAFVILNIQSNSLNFSDFYTVLNQNTQLANIVFLLSFIGFGTKAGFLPFHNWLPDAHPAAPSHVSGIMSGVMIKTGIYGILRIIWLIGIPSKFIAFLVLCISIISALWGVLYAITQHDIKRLLAYHSLENIGIIGIGIGVGLLGMVYNNTVVVSLGFGGGILHILNHAIFKPLLFFSAGNIYKQTHTKNIELLGGLIKKMPYTSFLFIIGSVAICGLPPLNGFISEFLIYAGIVLGLVNANNIAGFMTLILSLASLALVGTMAILCFTKVTGVMLLGNPRSENATQATTDVEKVMLIPIGILAILAVLIGFFPQYAILAVINPILEITHNNITPQTINSMIDLLGIISSIVAIFLIILLLIASLRFIVNRKSRVHNTWGCGYDKGNERMQYTAASYADLFVSTIKPMFKRIAHIKKPKELFPKEAYYEMEIEDLEEAYIVKPLIKLDEKLLSKFERIQNGNMQQYILFGLIFLILSIIGLFFIG
ncbi:MAG: proton-conducting transporter membrane subunit [Candidatus Avigastranaerophilus sp.]